MNCRFCSEPLLAADVVTVHSYWQGIPFQCHRQCRDAGVKAEAYDCQCIDADCNDCRHFQRGELIKRRLSAMVGGQPGFVDFNTGSFTGRCLKFDRPAFGHPKTSTGLPCFEHRKSPL